MISKLLPLTLTLSFLSLESVSLTAQQISCDENCATGGRGGVVYHVSRTDDPDRVTFGTLRYAVEQPGVRTIVFDTRGPITLTRDLILSTPDVTIAGQTAEGGFVGVTGHCIIVNCSNVVIDGLCYTVSGNAIHQSLTLQDILSIDSNMNGIPDEREKQLFGELVDGNGHVMDPVMTNLEWYLVRLSQKADRNDVSAIRTITVSKSDDKNSDSAIVEQSVIGLPRGEYHINAKNVTVR